MRIAAAIPLLVNVVVISIVAIRLLGLARRSGKLPEAALGFGLVLTLLVGQPLTVVGRLPATVGTPFGDTIFGAGLYLVHAGLGLIFLFTQQVFRPASKAARGCLGLSLVALVAVATGLLLAGLGGSSMDEIGPRTRPWAMATVLLVTAAFGWTGVEAALYYAKLRKRLRLGLTDPVVANRFALWAISGCVTAAMCLSLVGFLAAGFVLQLDPEPLIVIALMSGVASGAWVLGFLPPKAYIAWIERQASLPG